MMHLFSGHAEQSRELLKKLDDRHDAAPQLTLAQVGLGQSRGYLLVRELPDGSSARRWCILKDERLWFFDAPDSSKAGTSLPLENAVRAPVAPRAAGRSRAPLRPRLAGRVRGAGGRIAARPLTRPSGAFVCNTGHLRGLAAAQQRPKQLFRGAHRGRATVHDAGQEQRG